MSRWTVDEAGDLRRWLQGRQFELVWSAGEPVASFGDEQDIWERDGTLFRLTRDGGDWWCDVSRVGADSWIEVDAIASALASTAVTRVERATELSWSMRDVEFRAFRTIVPPGRTTTGVVVALPDR